MIGTPVANRRRAETEGLIGFFVNTLALRVDLRGEPSVVEMLKRVRGMVLGAQEHQDMPFEQVVEDCATAEAFESHPGVSGDVLPGRTRNG